MKKQPDFWHRLYIYALLILAVSGILRSVTALRLGALLQQYQSAASPLYLVISGALTAAGALIAAIGLWRGAPWAPWFTRIFISAFCIFYWLNRILLTQSDAARVNWTFALLVTIYILAYTYFITLPARSHSKRVSHA